MTVMILFLHTHITKIYSVILYNDWISFYVENDFTGDLVEL